MSFAQVEPIVRAVLYEGYLLYPYRRSALKNRMRWLFGRLLPKSYCVKNGCSESWMMRAECLIVGAPHAKLDIRVRFLQLLDDQARPDQSGDSEVAEREVIAATDLASILEQPAEHPFAFASRLEGNVRIQAAACRSGQFKLSVTTENVTPIADGDLDQVLRHSMLSALTLLRIDGGRFISSVDVPESCRALADQCQNVGLWPVLVGPHPGAMVLAAPIILGDFPQIAPESGGDSFDGTEIEELLALRVQTLTDAEKQAMAAAGHHAQRILHRHDSLAEEQMLKLHGRLRLGPASPAAYQPGDRVRLNPQRTADAMDLLLKGREATIVAIERDFEDRVYLAVVIDDDPGRSLGMEGFPGHRFFYSPEEVEPL